MGPALPRLRLWRDPALARLLTRAPREPAYAVERRARRRALLARRLARRVKARVRSRTRTGTRSARPGRKPLRTDVTVVLIACCAVYLFLVLRLIHLYAESWGQGRFLGLGVLLFASIPVFVVADRLLDHYRARRRERREQRAPCDEHV